MSSFHRSTNQKLGPKSKNIETLLDSIDSPYKNSLTEIKKIDPKGDDSDDFKTPIPIRNRSKLLFQPKTSQSKKNNSKKSSKNATKSSVLKTTKDNFKNLDVNAENLQLALALSKSTYDTENLSSQNNEEECTVFVDLPKNRNRDTALERFGFQSSKPKVVSDKPKLTLVHSIEVSILKHQNIHN